MITKDDMILNGKILEDKKNYFVKFANYHGTFHVEYKQIKGLYRTKSFEDDIKIYRNLGKSVNKAEVEINYQAGLKKLEEQEKLSEKLSAAKEPVDEKLSLLFSPFFIYNTGTLSSKLPYSFGVSAKGHIAIDQFSFFKKLYLYGITAELAYFHSKKGVKQVSGPRASAGPLWQFPFSIGSHNLNYCISPELGIGIYNIKGIYDDTTAVKWNIQFTTGPLFNISSVLLYPNMKFDYIYDVNVPLFGTGIGIDIGFQF
ncbi:MAG: hypothetical protein JW864_04715 [Spirochaetes bacterium]|nr:hypothetical protein [Spirochaetota bacterium]